MYKGNGNTFFFFIMLLRIIYLLVRIRIRKYFLFRYANKLFPYSNKEKTNIHFPYLNELFIYLNTDKRSLFVVCNLFIFSSHRSP